MPWDPEHGCNTPGANGQARHLGDPLTVQQIRDLSDGAEVVITWDGGNGPWPHRVLVDQLGERRVENPSCDALLSPWPPGEQVKPGHRVTIGWDEASREWAESKPPPQHVRERIERLRAKPEQPTAS